MSLIQFLTKLIIRNDSESNWEAVNPVLDKGEIGYVPDYPQLLKLGDGSNPWSILPFFTNHYTEELKNNIDIHDLFNPISQMTYYFKREDPNVVELVFLMNSYKNSNLDFLQCDGRVHKIIIENCQSSYLYVEAWLSTNEQNEGSVLRDFGTASILPGGYAFVEFFWYGERDRICLTRFTAL